MIGAISDALINRASARISETAPGRTPIAAARPPLVLPGFSNPRSIILISSMALSFPNFRNDSNSDYPKSSLTLISEYQKLLPWPGEQCPGSDSISLEGLAALPAQTLCVVAGATTEGIRARLRRRSG